MLQPVAKLLRHSHEEMTFLALNRSWSQVCEIWYWPPSSLPFKVVPPSFEHGLVLMATLTRDGGPGGSQAQDHGQAIYAKIQYSVSSTFAAGCSFCWLTVDSYGLFFRLIYYSGFQRKRPGLKMVSFFVLAQSRSQRPRSFWSATGILSNADSGNEIGSGTNRLLHSACTRY